MLFGGNKKLVKLHVNNCINEYNYTYFKIKIIYIRIIHYSCESKYTTIEERKYEYGEINDITIYKYLQKIIDKKIIENNKIYNFNDINFTNKLLKYKNKYNVVLLPETNNKMINYDCKDNEFIKIFKYLLCDTIINKEIFTHKFYFGCAYYIFNKLFISSLSVSVSLSYFLSDDNVLSE